jgi:hypothetical protein
MVRAFLACALIILVVSMLASSGKEKMVFVIVICLVRARTSRTARRYEVAPALDVRAPDSPTYWRAL